jgi:hypothetical protein
MALASLRDQECVSFTPISSLNPSADLLLEGIPPSPYHSNENRAGGQVVINALISKTWVYVNSSPQQIVRSSYALRLFLSRLVCHAIQAMKNSLPRGNLCSRCNQATASGEKKWAGEEQEYQE